MKLLDYIADMATKNYGTKYNIIGIAIDIYKYGTHIMLYTMRVASASRGEM